MRTGAGRRLIFGRAEQEHPLGHLLDVAIQRVGQSRHEVHRAASHAVVAAQFGRHAGAGSKGLAHRLEIVEGVHREMFALRCVGRRRVQHVADATSHRSRCLAKLCSDQVIS